MKINRVALLGILVLALLSALFVCLRQGVFKFKKSSEPQESQKPIVGQPVSQTDTNNLYSYFELESDNSKPSSGDKVNVDVYMTTSGDMFDMAIAALEWDSQMFDYLGASGNKSIDGGWWPGEFFPVLDTNSIAGKSLLALVHLSREGAANFEAQKNQRIKFASVVLQAKPTFNLSATVSLSELQIKEQKALHVNYCGPESTKIKCVRVKSPQPTVKQEMADQNKTKISFF